MHTKTLSGTATFHERFLEKINGYCDFLNGLEYQLQFKDERMLETVECEGANLWWLALNCLGRERHMNTTNDMGERNIECDVLSNKAPTSR